MSYFTSSHQRWWQPLVEILLLLIFWPLLVACSLGILELGATWTGQGGFVARGFVKPTDMYNTACCVVTLLMLGAGAPAALLAARIVRGRRWRSLLTTGDRFEWRFFFAGVAVVLPLSILTVCAMYLTGPARSFEFNGVLLFACVLLVPLQSIAEELIFRGVLAQAVGRWTRSWIAAIAVPLPLFVIGHEYSLVGLLAIAWFVVCVGYLAHRTGSLAAPMALHVANNLGYFLFGSTGLGDLNQVEVSLVMAGLDVVFCTLATLALLRLHGQLAKPQGGEVRLSVSQAESSDSRRSVTSIS